MAAGLGNAGDALGQRHERAGKGDAAPFGCAQETERRRRLAAARARRGDHEPAGHLRPLPISAARQRAASTTAERSVRAAAIGVWGAVFLSLQCHREQRRSRGCVLVQPKSLFYTAASIAHARTSRRGAISGSCSLAGLGGAMRVQPSLRRRRFPLNVAMSLAIPPARRNHGNAVRAPGGRNSAAAPATVSGEPKRIKPLGPRALGRGAKARTREPGDRPLTSSSSRRRWDGRGVIWSGSKGRLAALLPRRSALRCSQLLVARKTHCPLKAQRRSWRLPSSPIASTSRSIRPALT